MGFLEKATTKNNRPVIEKRHVINLMQPLETISIRAELSETKIPYTMLLLY